MAQSFVVNILFVQLCVMQLVTGKSCNWTYTGKDNLHCNPCLPGFKKTDDCLFDYTRAQCSPCPEGTFMSDCNTENTCLLCNNFCYGKGMDTLTNCTATTNSECRCMKGMFLTSDGYCQPHNTCTIGKGVKVPGNAFNDTICENCVSGETYSLNISAHEKCKPCTMCEAYMHHCFPVIDAECGRNTRTLNISPGDKKNSVGSDDERQNETVYLFPEKAIDGDSEKVSSAMTYSVIGCVVGIGMVMLSVLFYCILTPRCRKSNLQYREKIAGQHSRLLGSEFDGRRVLSRRDILDFCEETETNADGRDVPFPDNRPVHIVMPLISSRNETEENSAETRVIFSNLQDEAALQEYQNTSESTPLADLHENRQFVNRVVKRQNEKFLLSPEKAVNGGSEKGATKTDNDTNTDINWCKIFKDIVPMLPVKESSWKFFAFELFDFCQESKGLPVDIDNEVKRIENKFPKEISLAYYEVFQTWYRILADEASFNHIEKSLETLKDSIIMKKFLQIKSDPPKKTRPKPFSDLLVPYGHQHEQFIPQQPGVLAFAQHESTYETENTYTQRQEKQFLQLTNFGGETRDHISQTLSQKPSRTLTHGRRSRKQHERRILTYGHTKVKKQGCRESCKIQATESLKRLTREHIKTIKKNLHVFKIPLSKYEYNTFLDYTVDLMMEHNEVTRKVVLSVTFKAYEEIAKTKNGERYLLYCGSPKLNLERKQYENLKLYVNHARAKVLKMLEELGENADGIYLFLTYDGKSVLEGYQKKKSSVKERTYDSEYCGMDSISSSEDDSTTQSELSDIYDSSPTSPLETVANSPATNSYELTHSPDIIPSLQEEVNDTCLENLNSGKHAFSSCVSTSDSNTEQLKGRNDGGMQNDDTEEISMQQASDNTQLGARKEPINSHVNSKMLNEESVPYIDMSLDDLMENIDKELECSEYV